MEEKKENLDEFLADLQKECLQNRSDYIEPLREAALKMAKDLPGSITKFLKVCHNLKGNLQAVGFLHCAGFVHDLETIFQNLNEIAEKNGIQHFCEEDQQVFDFLLDDAINSLDTYFDELLKEGADSENLRDLRKDSINVLSTWRPIASSESEGAETNVETPDGKNDDKNDEIKADSKEEAGAKEESEIPLESKETDKGAQPKTKNKKLKIRRTQEKEKIENRLFLLCKNRNRLFAVPIDFVVEVVKTDRVNELPVVRDDINGILNLRGEPLPIMNFVHTFDFDEALLSSNEKKVRDNYCIIAEVKGNKFGFEIEDVQQVIELDQKKFQKPRQSDQATAGSLVSQYCLVEGKTVLIVELEGAIAA